VTDTLHAYRELVATRRSIRSFTDQPVERDVLRRLLHAACLAPSAHNRQPWRFVGLEGGELRDRLASAMAEPFRIGLAREGLDRDEIDRMVARGSERMMGSPVVVLLCLTMQDMHRYVDDDRARGERTMAVQSVALAGGQLLLAAHAEGLGACWVCSPLFTPAIVGQILDLPSDWEAQGMIALGYADEPGRFRERKPLEEVVLWR
jgi:coenzyme F420-0:L-glutamate ligase/coenzyme F420-1:gamma-L-glutamate ligase